MAGQAPPILNDLFPEDVACPRCRWTLFTGGMDEDAHAVACGPLPGRKGTFLENYFAKNAASTSEDLGDLCAPERDQGKHVKEAPKSKEGQED